MQDDDSHGTQSNSIILDEDPQPSTLAQEEERRTKNSMDVPVEKHVYPPFILIYGFDVVTFHVSMSSCTFIGS